MYTFSLRNLQHALHRIFLRIHNHMVRAQTLRELCLLLGARRADHCHALAFRELEEEKAEAARNGVYEDCLAGLDGVGFGDEGEGSETLDESGDGSERGDGRWDMVNGGPGDGDVGGVGTEFALCRLAVSIVGSLELCSDSEEDR